MVITQQPRIREQWNPTGRRDVQDYYTVRPCAHQDTGDYWQCAVRVDPDGKVKDFRSDEKRQEYLEDVQEEVHFVNSLRPDGILDYGAGLGWFLHAVEAKHKHAVEISETAIRQLNAAGIVTHTDCDSLPSSTFGVAIAHHVIEHLVDPIEAICTLRRVILPGGYLILGTPDFGSPCAKRFGDKYRMLHDPTHRSLFTLGSMYRCLSDYGFTIRDVRFPFPQRYATVDNFMRWNDTSRVSPPWPGNWMTFYCQR